MKIKVAHSPDADDAFMFYAMAKNKIDLKHYEFEHILCDIQTLSDKAINSQEFDITAISYYSLPKVEDRYELMSCGSSMGENYGPILVTDKSKYPSDDNIDELITKIKAGELTVGIPGLLTSAYLTLKMFAPNVKVIEYDFFEIEERIKDGSCDAGIIIHEGQVTLDEDKFLILEDLGQWWFKETEGLALPLGCNVISKRLPAEDRKAITEILSQSIQYALDNREAAIEYALQYGRGTPKKLADIFVGMYVNDLTVDLGEYGRESIREFYFRAKQQELISHIPVI